ncbi:hypothetical protein B0H13DRAFT_1895895 [Mycena leptocephala]|nr:hypothetical protein B0H13DRAFT_1895895 [Mycena leptocephala]
MAHTTRRGTQFSPFELDTIDIGQPIEQVEIVRSRFSIAPHIQEALRLADLRATMLDEMDEGNAISLPSDDPAAARRQHRAEKKKKRRQRGRVARAQAAKFGPLPKAKHSQVYRERSPHEIVFDAAHISASFSRWAGPPPSKRAKITRQGIRTLKALLYDDNDLVEWDGRGIKLIVDSEGRIVAVLLGRPDGNDWDEVVREFERVMEGVRRRGERCGIFNVQNRKHRRGTYHLMGSGVTKGPGQQKPGNLKHTKKYRQLLQLLILNHYIRRMIGFQSSGMARYLPKLYEFFSTTLKGIYENQPELEQLFSNSIFPAITWNLGPDVVTEEHNDLLNFGALFRWAKYGYKSAKALLAQVGGAAKKELIDGDPEARAAWALEDEFASPPSLPLAQKIRLFGDQSNHGPTVLNFDDPPLDLWQHWMGLAGVVAAAEGGARMIEIRQIRATLVEEVNYQRVVESLKNLREVTGYRAYQRAKAQEEEVTHRRLPRAKDVLRSGIHIRPTKGLRQPCSTPLEEDDLYLDTARPTLLEHVKLEHTCTLCLNAKSHPVFYECKHSHCYVCIRISLETSWLCPQCQRQMTARPLRDDDGATEIAKDYPGWDESKVAYRYKRSRCAVGPVSFSAVRAHMGTILASDVVDNDPRDISPREVEEMVDVNPTFAGLQAEQVSARVKNKIVIFEFIPKRKYTAADDDLNDGSDSDNSLEDYTPRAGGQRIHHVVDEAISITQDGRVRSAFTTVETPASPAKKSRVTLNPEIAPNPTAPSTRPDLMEDFSEFDAEYGPGLQGALETCVLRRDDPNELWARLDCMEFLDELLRHDGRGDYIHQHVCAGEGCETVHAVFRCSDCLHSCLYCETCIAEVHRWTPLHHVEEWDGKHFKRRTLKSLGIRIQLGHPLGEPCAAPVKAAGDDFVIIGSQTIDEVGLDYCGCGTARSKPIQLLRMRLYPTTGTNPRSAATFAVLDRYTHMNLESKCSAYEFYNSLAHETNNTGLEPSRERYEEFLRMTRQWHHLYLLKRAGVGHNPSEDRIGATKPGECALLCPACPQPGKNLPPDWDKVPFEKAFLYALFLALDANFRLKCKGVSSEEKDPGLGTGLAFFGDVKEYMAHLDKHWDQKQERSTCVAHDAVDKPDRESLGTASSGIGTVDCARHNMKRPNAVGDLQKGERYLNMDYMFFMSLAGSPLQRLYVSYDIACQWHKNIRERMKIFDYEGIQFKDGEKYVVFLMPKFHLPAHIELCNILFSFNLTPFVGRTDGEAPERGWADANRLANSTSISGPGARRDMLDAHFQYWNWKKIITLGRVMLERMQKYVPLMLETRAAWVDMEASFSPAVIEAWTAMAVAWEKDATAPNPFASKVNHVDLKAVRRKLAAIASEDVEHLRVCGDMHDTEMLSMGLKLEEEQCAFISSPEDKQLTFINRATPNRAGDETAPQDRHLDGGAAALHPGGIRAQDMKLWLPSAIGTRAQRDVELLEYEYELRKGQAFAALEEIRGQLLVRTHEYKYKDKSLRGNKAKTRSATRMKAIDARIERASEEYCTAYAALVSLGAALKQTEWQQHLKVLKPGDARGWPSSLFGDEERQKGGGRRKKAMDPEEVARRAALRVEGKMAMSWIWLSQGADGKEGTLSTMRVSASYTHYACRVLIDCPALRVEWAKTRARGMRYGEEVDLGEEEMRRVLDFLDRRGEWWRSRVALRVALQPEAALREGHSAYAHKQADIMEGLSASFRLQWADVEGFLELARAEYASMTPDDDEEEEEADEEGPDSGWLSENASRMNWTPPVVVCLIGTSVNVSARSRRHCQTESYTLAIVYDDELALPYIVDGKAGAVFLKGGETGRNSNAHPHMISSVVMIVRDVPSGFCNGESWSGHGAAEWVGIWIAVGVKEDVGSGWQRVGRITRRSLCADLVETSAPMTVIGR